MELHDLAEEVVKSVRLFLPDSLALIEGTTMTIRKKTLMLWGAVGLQMAVVFSAARYGLPGRWPSPTGGLCYLAAAGIFALGRYSQRVDPDPVT